MNQILHKTDKKPLAHLLSVIKEGDISLVLLIGGMGLIMWALFGIFAYPAEVIMYANLFPFGNPMFWLANYILCGISMWLLVAFQYPPTFSLLVGTWCSIVWSWSALGRMNEMATFQTGNATSIIYVLIGLLIIQRTARLRT